MPSLRTKYFITLILLGVCISTHAQNILDNASFEGEPQDATIPHGWFGCEEGTTPDILPGPWGVYLEPSDGDTYVGLITRDNGTYESIGQRLKTPLSKDQCYKIALDLAHSNTYSGYNGAIKIRAWGGKTKCEQAQILFETDYIQHIDWKSYEFKFTPESEIQYILFEAFYKDGSFRFRGNILIDAMSA
ncbi:MAG: hypothetical protein AAGK97_14920, partial [Bacteroidota bacterium]